MGFRATDFIGGGRRGFGAALAGIVFFAGLGLPLGAQEAAPPARPDPGAAEAQLAAVEADASIAGELKEALRPKYAQAIADLKEAESSFTRAAQMRTAAAAAPATVEDLRAKLAALPAEGELEIPRPEGAVEALQKDLESRRVALAALKADYGAIGSELDELLRRPAQISERLPAARRDLRGAEEALAAAGDLSAEPTPAELVDRLLLDSAVSKWSNEVAALEAEQLTQAARGDLLRAKRELFGRQIGNAEETVAALAQFVSERLAEEAKAVVASSPRELAGDDPAAVELADEVELLAKEFETLVSDLEKVTRAADEARARAETLDERFGVIRNQIELGVSGGAIAQLLFDLRRQLPTPRALQRQIGQLDLELNKAQLASLKVEQRLRATARLEASFARPLPEGVARLLEMRAEVLGKLRSQYAVLVRARGRLNTEERGYMGSVIEAREILDKKLFWMRSSPVISVDTVTSLPSAAVWFLGGERWGEVGAALAREAGARPLPSGVILLILALLLGYRGRMIAALLETGVSIRRTSTDRYAFTARALLLSALLALPVPLLVGFGGWLLWQVEGGSAWLGAVGTCLRGCAWLLLPLFFFRSVCRSGGLGEAHFRWPAETLPKFRRASGSLAAVYIPTLFVAGVCFLANESGHFDSLGRAACILGLVWMAAVFWRLFASTDGALTPLVGGQQDRVLVRWRRLWVPLLIALPIFLILLGAAGYLISAVSLSVELFVSAAIAVTGLILYRLVLRWFMIHERKLALEEALELRRQRHEEAAREEAGEEDEEGGEVVEVDLHEEELDLESIGTQTRELLRFLFGAATALVVAFFWSRTIPFLEPLATLHPLFGLSLIQIAKLALVLVVAVIAVKNLPGLLELAVLRRTSMDVGARYAVSTLCRYAVIAIAVYAVFDIVQVDWAKFGWAAAALGVGLGFGLQEVVANFVCGLILLFERPVRVGDVVTIDGITGTVTRIRIRATEITDWDRKEFVVPNKSVITGTLLNWTLSNSTNRLVIPVGVAYGSDTEKARQILLEVAEAHPEVLEDPAPSAAVEDFGASSVNLCLRACLPSLENRLRTRTELHEEIQRRLAEVGIVIAFPQLDVHLQGGGAPEV